MQLTILSGFNLIYKHALFLLVSFQTLINLQKLNIPSAIFFASTTLVLLFSSIWTSQLSYFMYFSLCSILFLRLQSVNKNLLTLPVLNFYCFAVSAAVILNIIASRFVDISQLNTLLRALSGSSLHFLNAKPPLFAFLPTPLWLPFFIFNPLFLYLALINHRIFQAALLFICCVLLAQKTAILISVVIVVIYCARINLYFVNIIIIIFIVVTPIFGFLYVLHFPVDFNNFNRWGGFDIRLAQILSLLIQMKDNGLFDILFGLSSGTFFSHLQGVDLSAQEIDTLNVLKNFGILGSFCFWLWIITFVTNARNKPYIQQFIFLWLVIFSSNPGLWTPVSAILLSQVMKWRNV